MADDGTHDDDLAALGGRLSRLMSRLQSSSITHEQSPAVLEAALADKVWRALAGRHDRIERVIGVLHARMRATKGGSK